MAVGILPQEIQNELMVLRDVHSMTCWRIGDLTNQVIDWAIEQQENAPTREMIYSAVGNIVGKLPRTIREYASISRKYPPEIRQQYDVLAYDYFRNALTLCPDNPASALEWCIQQGDILGRPATVAAMVAHFVNLNTASEQTRSAYQDFIPFGNDREDYVPPVSVPTAADIAAEREAEEQGSYQAETLSVSVATAFPDQEIEQAIQTIRTALKKMNPNEVPQNMAFSVEVALEAILDVVRAYRNAKVKH